MVDEQKLRNALKACLPQSEFPPERRQAVLLRNFVKVQEPGAFLMITNSSEIIGKGFQGF